MVDEVVVEQIRKLKAKGYPVSIIAKTLGLSEETVKQVLEEIYKDPTTLITDIYDSVLMDIASFLGDEKVKKEPKIRLEAIKLQAHIQEQKVKFLMKLYGLDKEDKKSKRETKSKELEKLEKKESSKKQEEKEGVVAKKLKIESSSKVVVNKEAGAVSEEKVKELVEKYKDLGFEEKVLAIVYECFGGIPERLPSGFRKTLAKYLAPSFNVIAKVRRKITKVLIDYRKGKLKVNVEKLIKA